MVAYSYRMPAGIPGDINRIAAATIEAQVMTPSGVTGHPTKYGIPMVVDATGGNVGNMRTMQAGDAAVYGLLCRPFPTGGTQDPLGTSTPPSEGACDIMVRGYMTVLLGGASAAVKGAPAYIWNQADSSPSFLGGWTAASSTNVISVGAYFMGPADSSGNVEVAFNI